MKAWRVLGRKRRRQVKKIDATYRDSILKPDYIDMGILLKHETIKVDLSYEIANTQTRRKLYLHLHFTSI